MRPWIVAFIGISVLIIAALSAISYLYGRSLRQAGIIEGKGALMNAAKEYASSKTVTNYGGNYQVWLSSNTVTVGGTQYQCFITANVPKFYNQGTLAITTNGTYLWLDAQHPPKIIGADYTPPLFPPRF